ncbi:hypothetical protein CHUAL_003312 [Chamberlinius hualienensis]
MATKSEKFTVLPLHHHPQYKEECSLILNAEWPRSRIARLHELSKSSDELPCSLVLVRKTDEDVVIGHSKIGLVAGQTRHCCIKSVVIRNEFRGQGMGKLLMLETEAYAFSLGYHWSCLTTHDQQGFYQKLGYIECTPMCFLASGKTSLTSKLLEKMETSKLNENNQVWSQNESNNNSSAYNNDALLPPPPPPPPLPAAKMKCDKSNSVSLTWMKKKLIEI